MVVLLYSPLSLKYNKEIASSSLTSFGIPRNDKKGVSLRGVLATKQSRSEESRHAQGRLREGKQSTYLMPGDIELANVVTVSWLKVKLVPLRFCCHFVAGSI